MFRGSVLRAQGLGIIEPGLQINKTNAWNSEQRLLMMKGILARTDSELEMIKAMNRAFESKIKEKRRLEQSRESRGSGGKISRSGSKEDLKIYKYIPPKDVQWKSFMTPRYTRTSSSNKLWPSNETPRDNYSNKHFNELTYQKLHPVDTTPRTRATSPKKIERPCRCLNELFDPDLSFGGQYLPPHPKISSPHRHPNSPSKPTSSISPLSRPHRPSLLLPPTQYRQDTLPSPVPPPPSNDYYYEDEDDVDLDSLIREKNEVTLKVIETHSLQPYLDKKLDRIISLTAHVAID